MKFLNKKNKIKLLKHSWVLGLGIIPIVASTCGVSSTFIKNSYFTSNSNGKLSSNLSLTQISKDSLKTNSGMQSYLKSVVNKILYNWLVNLAQKNSDYKSKLDSEIKTVNDSYNDSVDSYKDKYGSSWQLKFQQEVLDPAGGTKESYINNQLYSFARTTLTNDLFSSLYVCVYDDTNKKVVLNPTADQIFQALKNMTSSSGDSTSSTPKYVFKFDRGIDLLSKDNPGDEFAKFQDFIFQKYVQYENPYIVDYSLWKYSTPSGTDGINSVYNTSNTGSDNNDSSNNNSGSGDSSSGSGGGSSSTKSYISKISTSLQDDSSSSDDSNNDSSGDSSTTTTTGGSYAFPYFGNEGSTNDSISTINKFLNFVKDSKTNSNYNNSSNGTTTINDSSSDNLGLKSINLKYTDDTSTMKLVKNNSIFSDQSVEFAAAASYMYGVLGNNSSGGSSAITTVVDANSSNSASQITNINSSITHNIDLTNNSSKNTDKNNNPFDLITRNFVSSNDLYNSSTTSGKNTSDATANNISKLKISADYLKKIINPNGPLSSLLNNSDDYYVIDNFIPGNITTSSASAQVSTDGSSNSLSNFMFFRDSTGVQAVSIDGDTLINKATTISQKKKNAAMVVLYRYFLGNDTGASFTVNLSSELSSFFSTNIDWLIYQYATESGLKELDGSTYSQAMFTNNLSGSDKNLATAIANFLPASTYYNSSYTAAQKMYEAKKTYNQNYGYSVYKNGLASNFNYSYASDSQASNSGVNSSFLYTNALLASTANNPYLTTTTSINADSMSLSGNKDSSKQTDSLYNAVLNAIDVVTNSLTVQKAYFDKYTQYVYSNNEYVNAALLGVLSNTSFLSSEIENPILSSYIGDFYTINSQTKDNDTFNSFKLSSNPFDSSESTTNIQTYLQNAMYNFYFLSSFTGETDSLFSYGATDNTKSSTNVADSTPSISLDNIRKYSWDLWNSSNKLDYSSQVINYNALYKTVATVKYLLGTDLSNFLSYMKDLVGNDNAFVVWENSENVNTSSLANFNTTSKASGTTNSSNTPSSSSLISYSTPITNINNQSYGPYVGKNNSSTSSLSYNVYSSNLYQTTLNSSYYSATTGSSSTGKATDSTTAYKMGFKGLQTASNKSLSDDVSDVLFTNPWKTNIGTTGVLYQYKSLDNLKNIVNGISSISDLTTLVTNIDTLTNFKFNFSDDISSEISLSAKKSKLINSLQTNLGTTSSSSSNYYFTPFSGYVGVNSSTSSASTTNNVSAYGSSTSKYGIFAYQLNADSFTSLDSLRKALGANGAKDTSSNDQADEIICNLIVQYAAQSTNQSYIIPTIVKDSRVDIYDIRVYNAFSSDGLTWVKNWRTITTSSGNSSDSSSGSSD